MNDRDDLLELLKFFSEKNIRRKELYKIKAQKFIKKIKTVKVNEFHLAITGKTMLEVLDDDAKYLRCINKHKQ